MGYKTTLLPPTPLLTIIERVSHNSDGVDYTLYGAVAFAGCGSTEASFSDTS
jgi:hypothetical protein